jgi:glycosyltransferase involved in cell wall biosynthesis
MRLLFVIQRYDSVGLAGDMVFSREFATRLAHRGHDVEVVTSCASSYVDWANVFEPGTYELDGVTVHRLPVVRPREHELFNYLSMRVIGGRKPVPLYVQDEWMRFQGPEIPTLAPWLQERVADYDAAVVYTYNYYTTWVSMPVASASVPTIFHPTAHDEPAIWLPVYDMSFRLAHGFGFLTEEEAAFVHERFRVDRPSVTTGIGVTFDSPVDVEEFRRAYNLGDDPFLVCVGRMDPHKGTHELFAYFVKYKERNPGPLRLVFVGVPITPLPPHPDVIVTGFASDAIKDAAIAECLALVAPSYFESYSIVLVEGWARRRPGLVQGRCAMTAGQARRANAGLPYVGYAEFEAALDMLVEDPDLRRRMGEAGRAYAERRYEWEHVLDRYERFLELTAR